MKFVAQYNGRRDEIVIMEDRDTGARAYYEGDAFQAHARPDGESLFAYVHLMARLLQRAENILVLGCAAGSLATMLCRQGKRVTLVDDNPVSFVIARRFFGLPNEVTCAVEDFQDFLAEEQTCFDGIAIDIGAPRMNYEEVFDPYACRAVRSRLARGGRIAMNMIVRHDLDSGPDRILAMLAASDLNGWIYDEPGTPDRNAVLSVEPEKRRDPRFSAESLPLAAKSVAWERRRQRIFRNVLPRARRVTTQTAELDWR